MEILKISNQQVTQSKEKNYNFRTGRVNCTKFLNVVMKDLFYERELPFSSSG